MEKNIQKNMEMNRMRKREEQILSFNTCAVSYTFKVIQDNLFVEYNSVIIEFDQYFFFYFTRVSDRLSSPKNVKRIGA